jgi:hypothetical protein
MAVAIDESFGTMPESSVDERVEAGRKLATQLLAAIPGYTYKLKTQEGTDKKTGKTVTYVNLYINGKGGARPGRIGIGNYATPIVWPSEDQTATEAFVNAADTAGIALKVYQAG